MEINVDGLISNLDYLVADGENVLFAGIYERSKTKANAIGAKFGYRSIRYRGTDYCTVGSGWNVQYIRVPMRHGRDSFYYANAISTDVNEKYLVTTQELVHQDMYNFLMKKFKLPLLEEWIPELSKVLISDGYIDSCLYSKTVLTDDVNRTISLHGKSVRLDELLLFNVEPLTESIFESVVSYCLSNKIIQITDADIPEMSFKNFDDYISKYGSSLVMNLEEKIKPLIPLMGDVEGLALKHKRLFPQQGVCVNGVKALWKTKQSNFAILNEGMGVGKTLQSLSIVESCFIERFLEQNPDKTLKDALQLPDKINYRVIVMAPGHLIEKWAQEIKDEIPFAKPVILNDFSQLVKIRDAGKERHGREFYIIGKDFCKLGNQISPIPTKVATRRVKVPVCEQCLEAGKTVFREPGQKTCHVCSGSKFVFKEFGSIAEHETGMVCPHCDNLLLKVKNSKQFLDFNSSMVMQPEDFSDATSSNAKCYHCEKSLWGASCKPIGVQYKEPKWYKISHYTNAKKNTTKTAWVLRGHEDSYLQTKGFPQYKVLGRSYGPRKYAPAMYIKKYLKGYFDFCILDEAHKYEGSSAQANAAHALVKASNFTMGLTGTISNGSAANFYYLFWMLDPIKMRQMGYTYSHYSLMQFVRTYGSIETQYENHKSDDRYNSTSRGRQISQPKVKPGISPMIFIDFLMENAVFLDITDLSMHLPPLREEVITMPLPSEVAVSYQRTIAKLKECLYTEEGKSSLSAILQFGLSYADKPFGRSNIKSAIYENTVIAPVDNHDVYAEGALLPKEEELVSIIKNEIAENRNVFVYASYTGDGEYNVTNRLKGIIEDHCNLHGRVQILMATSPEPRKREAYIKKLAEKGTKVIITNPKNVETGLDFCFTYNGKKYNFPTLVFYQISYEMAVMWQASRRGYRLNQTEECRNYYLGYEDTLQLTALELMAAKQVATSAIQGKFSTEGLSAMARGVDTRTQLAAALAKNDVTSTSTLAGMFDAINQANNSNTENSYGDYVLPKTYYEVIGESEPIVEDENSLLGFTSYESGVGGQVNMLKGLGISQKITSKSSRKVTEDHREIDDIFTKLFTGTFTSPVVQNTCFEANDTAQTATTSVFSSLIEKYSSGNSFLTAEPKTKQNPRELVKKGRSKKVNKGFDGLVQGSLLDFVS